MTAFTTLLNALFIPGKPILGSTGSALRDNAIAMFEGDPSAPKLKLAALENPTAGNVPRSRVATATTSVTTSDVVVNAFGFGQTGSVRVMASHRQTIGGAYTSTLIFKRWRNGSFTTLATYTTTSTSLVVRLLDVAVIPGDTLTIEHRWSYTGGGASVVEFAIFATGGESLWPFAEYTQLE